MLIQKLELKNFKRFTDLTIDLSGEKETPKLVLLIGANGSGKSCVFDAFQRYKRRLITTDNPTSYFVKNWSEGEGQYQIIINQNNNYEFNFYGLTAFRYIPSITKSQIGGRTANEYKLFIEEEKDKFDQNIDILFSRLIASLSDKNDNFAQDFETKIKSGFSNIFGNSVNSLNFEKYESPIIGQTPVKFLFSKGESNKIDYSYLSAGEKMIFIILFDLYLNVLGLENTVVYLDELDSHLNTSLQKNLLKEITENWIPDSCQLWTASHSLGFIQYATEYDRGVVIDFDNRDFDIQQTLVPRPNDLDVYEIAVPKNILKRIFGDRKIIYVENKNDALYQLALGDKSTIFFPAQNNTDIYNLAKSDHWSIRDRDYLQSYEIKELQSKIPKLKILGYYTFENYLYHPDNIAEVVPNFDKLEYIQKITDLKNNTKSTTLTKIVPSRQTYSEFKFELNDSKQFPKDNVAEIIKALDSDDFETFYTYFNAKEMDRSYLAKYNLNTSSLVQTTWFKTQISSIINN